MLTCAERRSGSRSRWLFTIVVLIAIAGISLGAYIFYKYHLQVMSLCYQLYNIYPMHHHSSNSNYHFYLYIKNAVLHGFRDRVHYVSVHTTR